MKKAVLIVGLGQHSGKTSVAIELIREAKRLNIDVGVSKPLSTLNAFYSNLAFEEVLRLGKLVSYDVLKMREVAESKDRIELENPVASLLAPQDPEKIGWNMLNYESLVFQTLYIRVSTPDETRLFVVEPEDRFVDSVYEKAKKIKESYDVVERISPEHVEDVLIEGRRKSNIGLKEITKTHELTVIESSSNLAFPNEFSLNAESVIVVSPGKYFLCDGDRYRKTVEVLNNLNPFTRTEDVVELLKPEKSYANIKNLIKDCLLNH